MDSITAHFTGHVRRHIKHHVNDNKNFETNCAPYIAANYGAQLVPPNFSHQVSFTRRQFSLARLFFFGTTLFFRHDFFFGTSPFFRHDCFFFGTTFFLARLFFFRHDVFLRHNFLFSARPGQVTADQYYCSGMEHMVNSTVVQILGTRLLRSPV